MATTTFQGALGTGARTTTPGLFARVAGVIGRRMEIWQAESELNAMSDRELHDIGVTREQIPAFVRRGK